MEEEEPACPLHRLITREPHTLSSGIQYEKHKATGRGMHEGEGSAEQSVLSTYGFGSEDAMVVSKFG